MQNKAALAAYRMKVNRITMRSGILVVILSSK